MTDDDNRSPAVPANAGLSDGGDGAPRLPARPGDLLRRYREARRLTQAELAARSCVSWHTVSALERGRAGPRSDTLKLLVAALKLDDQERDDLRTSAAMEKAVRRRRDNLPLALSEFVGREAEVATVGTLIGAHRLVTLTGAGGVGKTRLALEAARRAADLPHGAWFADLAPVADPGLVPAAAAAALGVPTAGRDPVGALQLALRSRRLLLVLDNCEHLVAACARLADALLCECPHVRVLATSREPLRLPGEVAWQVPSFAVPPSEAETAETLLRYDAVRLFVDRAAAAAPGFRLTDESAGAVAELCRRLDGIPLALELAAARLRGLSVAQVAARLDDRFALLTGGSRAALPRQQTLKAAVDWSFDLLTPAEQVLFVRLSVFAGTFTLEAVEAVAGDGPSPPTIEVATAEEAQGGHGPGPTYSMDDDSGGSPLRLTDVLDALLRLVDKSLVIREPRSHLSDVPVVGADSGDGVDSYRVLETLREYGRDRLDAGGDALRIRRRHLAYFLDRAERAVMSPPVPTSAAAGPVGGRENLRAALRWVRDTGDAESDRWLRAFLARLIERARWPGLLRAAAPVVFELRSARVPAYGAFEQGFLASAEPDVLDAGVDVLRAIEDWDAAGGVLLRRQAVDPDPLRSARAAGFGPASDGAPGCSAGDRRPPSRRPDGRAPPR